MKQEFWVIKFDDDDAGDLVFAGEGAEEAAQETYKLRSQSWNCHLFGPAELIATLRSENELLIAAWAAYAASRGCFGKAFKEAKEYWTEQVSRERTQATQKGSEPKTEGENR